MRARFWQARERLQTRISDMRATAALLDDRGGSDREGILVRLDRLAERVERFDPDQEREDQEREAAALMRELTALCEACRPRRRW
jgi:hypothetical protein